MELIEISLISQSGAFFGSFALMCELNCDSYELIKVKLEFICINVRS